MSKDNIPYSRQDYSRQRHLCSAVTPVFLSAADGGVRDASAGSPPGAGGGQHAEAQVRRAGPLQVPGGNAHLLRVTQVRSIAVNAAEEGRAAYLHTQCFFICKQVHVRRR